MTVSKTKVFSELESGDHGRFAQCLAKAWTVADSTNRDIIEKNWPHLIWKAQRVVEIQDQFLIDRTAE